MSRGVKAEWFAIELYEETYETALANLDTCGYQYALMKHDKDTKKDGAPKKVHWHGVVLNSGRLMYRNTLANALSIDPRFVQAPKADKPNGALRYLCHLDNPEKYQYSLSDIVTNISEEDMEELLEKVETAQEQTEEEKTEKLLTDIENLANGKMGYRAFLKANPSFIYQSNSLLKLVQMAKDIQWRGVVDPKTGDYVEDK